MNWAIAINSILEKLGFKKLLYGLLLTTLTIKFIPEDWVNISKSHMSYINIILIFCLSMVSIDFIVNLYIFIQNKIKTNARLKEFQKESRQKELDMQREMLVYLEENDARYGRLFKHLLLEAREEPDNKLIRILDSKNAEELSRLDIPRKICPGGNSYIPYYTQSSNYRIIELSHNFLSALKRYYVDNNWRN